MNSTPLLLTSDLLDTGSAGLQGHVVASGEIDAVSSPELSAALRNLIASDARSIILDATDVTFLDSSGLRVLVDVSRELEGSGGSLVIDGMSAAVERVLEITGMLERYRSPSPDS